MAGSFRYAIPRIWNSVENVRDKELIRESEPWIFDSALILFAKPRSNRNFDQILFRSMVFWMNVRNIPPAEMNERFAREIGNTVGEFIRVATDDNGNCWSDCLRIRVIIPTNQPLVRGIRVAVEGQIEGIWCLFAYERLPDFCYYCVKLGHFDKECNIFRMNNRAEKMFSSWLRASPQILCQRKIHSTQRFIAGLLW